VDDLVQPAGTQAIVGRLGHTLQRHGLGIACALLLATVLVAPRWWLLTTDPPAGVRTQVNPGGTFGIGHDEAYYIPGIRSAYEGRLPVTDPYLVNHQDGPPQTAAFWQEAVGILAHATAGNIFLALAIVASCAAVATFLLLYALALQLTGSRAAAIAALFIIMAYVEVYGQAAGYLPLRHWVVLKPIITVRPPGQFHVWYRFLAPAMTQAPLLGLLLVVRRAFETRQNRWSVAAAILLALVVYTYAFFWTAIAVALALWGLWRLIERDYATAARLAVIGLGAAVLAMPELAILGYNAVSVPFHVKARSGLGHLGIDSGTFVSVAQRVLVGIPFAWFAWRRTTWARLFIAMYVAPLGLATTTGIVPQPDHYLFQAWPLFSLPLFISGIAGFMGTLEARRRHFGALALAAIAAGSGVYVVAFQVRAINQLNSSYALRADEAAAFSWMRATFHHDETVVTPSASTNLLLASLTPAFVYVPYGSSAVGSKASDDEIIERYLRASAAFGYTSDTAIGRLDPANGIPIPGTDLPLPDIPIYVERSMIDYLLNEFVVRPDIVNPRIPEWRSRFMALKSQAGVLDAYAATYLYCGPLERLWPVDEASPGTLVTVAFQQDQVTVYRLGDAPGAVPFRGC
jgi:hypothetical protein